MCLELPRHGGQGLRIPVPAAGVSSSRCEETCVCIVFCCCLSCGRFVLFEIKACDGFSFFPGGNYDGSLITSLFFLSVFFFSLYREVKQGMQEFSSNWLDLSSEQGFGVFMAGYPPQPQGYYQQGPPVQGPPPVYYQERPQRRGGFLEGW